MYICMYICIVAYGDACVINCPVSLRLSMLTCCRGLEEGAPTYIHMCIACIDMCIV